MALTTKVGIEWRTAYQKRRQLPDQEERQMRKEITDMRKNLLKKQNRLERSEYGRNETLTREIKSISVRKLSSKESVWRTWSKLRDIEEEPRSSVTGMRKREQHELESLHLSGYDFITKDNLRKFGEFMEFVRENYGGRHVVSEEAVEYFYERKEMSIDELEEGFGKWLYSR